jgi:hypothetical protein
MGVLVWVAAIVIGGVLFSIGFLGENVLLMLLGFILLPGGVILGLASGSTPHSEPDLH